MIDLFSDDKILMDFLAVKVKQANLFSNTKVVKTKKLKDKGQREDCRCIMSKEIAKKNDTLHLTNPNSETIKGD